MNRRSFFNKVFTYTPFYLTVPFFARLKVYKLNTQSVRIQDYSDAEWENIKRQYYDADALEALYENFVSQKKIISKENYITGNVVHWNLTFSSAEARQEWVDLTAPMFDLDAMNQLNAKSTYQFVDSYFI